MIMAEFDAKLREISTICGATDEEVNALKEEILKVTAEQAYAAVSICDKFEMLALKGATAEEIINNDIQCERIYGLGLNYAQMPYARVQIAENKKKNRKQRRKEQWNQRRRRT